MKKEINKDFLYAYIYNKLCVFNDPLFQLNVEELLYLSLLISNMF